MFIGKERAFLIAAGFFLGGATYAALRSGAARKTAVGLVNKGIKLKEGVACSVEAMKENFSDIVAEAKEMEGCCCCESKESAE